MRAPSPSLLLVLGAWAVACSAVPVAWQEFREPQPEEHDLPPPPGPTPYTAALVVGTQLFWVWETPGSASVSGVCILDEAARVDGRDFLHVTCLPDLPPKAPPFWRTGCHVLTWHGIWRLPRCPGDEADRSENAVLVAPSPVVASPGRFIDLGLRGAHAVASQIAGAPVESTCYTRDTHVVSHQCVAEGWGPTFSGVTAGRDAGIVRLLGKTAVEVAPVPSEHLRGMRSGSVGCSLGADCFAFGECVGTAQGCRAASDADCRASLRCRQAGLCTQQFGACSVGPDADCRASIGCLREGRCSARVGRCAVGTDEDCYATPACTDEARCTARAGRCTLTGDADCRRSAACAAAGLCRLHGGVCAALDDLDCAGSRACTERTLCTARDGRCVSPPLQPTALPPPPRSR